MKTTASKSTRHHACAHDGFTLIEVLVALVVLAIGLLGLAMLQTTGMRFNTNSYSRTQATYMAYDIAERMRANSTAFQAGDYDVGNLTAANTIVGSTNYSCNLPANNNCTCNSSACTSAALAQYDLGQWYYNLDSLLPGTKDAANLTNTPMRATITHNNDTAYITIYWAEQNRNASSAASPALVSQSWRLDIY